MMEADEQRSEGNASEDDTDLECEEEEVANQSDSGTERAAGGQQARLSGRKRAYSETTTSVDQLSPTSPDAKCRQASNLHNKREKERRKDLKLAVHRLRNQLQLRKTKKATTISVLKASEQEIKDLLSMEAAQNRELGELQNHHKRLTWKLETLMAEQQRESSGTGTSSNPPPSLTPTVPAVPPLTSVAPMFYMPPPTPSTPHSTSVPGSPHHAMMMQAQPSPSLPAASPTPFPFGPGLSPLTRFQQQPPLLSPTAPFPLTATHPQHMFSLHAGRPFLVMPSASPQAFALRSFLPHLPAAQGQFAGRFPFPSPTSPFSSHLPLSPSSYPSLPPMLPSVPPPGPVGALPHTLFQQLLMHSTETSNLVSPTTAVDLNTSSGPPTPQNVSLMHHREQERHLPSSQNLVTLGDPLSSISQASESPHPSTHQMQQNSPRSNSRLSSDETSSKEEEENGLDGDLIDVETTDQEEEGEVEKLESVHQVVSSRHAFLDIHTQHQHKQQRKRMNQAKTISLNEQRNCTKSTTQGAEISSKNWRSPPALVNVAGETDHSNTVSQIIKRVEPATKVLTQDMITSALEKHSLYFDNDTPHTDRNGENLDPWKRGPNIDQISPNSSPLVIDHHPMCHPPPVICS